MNSMKIFLANLRLYSMQGLAFLFTLNSFYMFLLTSAPERAAEIPMWIVWVLNVGGLAYGWIGRQIPQPAAVARIEDLKTGAS